MKLHIFMLSEHSVLNTVQWFLVYALLLCIYIFFFQDCAIWPAATKWSL